MCWSLHWASQGSHETHPCACVDQQRWGPFHCLEASLFHLHSWKALLWYREFLGNSFCFLTVSAAKMFFTVYWPFLMRSCDHSSNCWMLCLCVIFLFFRDHTSWFSLYLWFSTVWEMMYLGVVLFNFILFEVHETTEFLNLNY